MKVIKSASTPVRKAVGYRTYRLENKSTKDGHTISKNISRMLKQMTVQMKSYVFHSFEPVSIIGILCNFKLACDATGIHESATI